MLHSRERDDDNGVITINLSAYYRAVTGKFGVIREMR